MGTTADKLQRLVEGKQAIVDAVNSKSNTSLTINSKLSDVASAINNISVGTNTSDATAVASDILKSKTAYTADGKVEGTIETYNGETVGGAEKQQNLLQKQIDEHTARGLFAGWVSNRNLDEYINSLDFSRTSSTHSMFKDCQNVMSIPFFNTNNITDMSDMFNGCYRITTIPLLDTSNVTKMNYMFYACGELTSIPQLDTSSVTTMNSMFYQCSKLPTIPQLDTSNVIDMSYMFCYCKLLPTIPQLDTSNVTNMSYMFNNCYALTSIPQLDTSKVRDISSMFSSCSKLVDIPQLNTIEVTKVSNTFYKCSLLETIDITYYNISSTSNSSNFVQNCSALKSLIIREFGANYVLSSNSFTGSGIANGTGYIYVPRSMVSILQSATNWSTYATQIRALEDYTIDGTTTGALDESKI